jgi:hypothetical protein
MAARMSVVCAWKMRVGVPITILELREVVRAWAKGTFNSRAASIRYHYDKHGSGRGLLQYT